MKIIRDGTEFILTPQELSQAYREQEHLYDMSNIRDNMEGYLLSPLYDRLKNNEDFIATAADALRRNQDHYDMGYDAALSTAFKEATKDFLLLVNQVSLIRERCSEHKIWVDDFWVDASKTPSKELFQKAVETFLMTKNGQKAVEGTCNDFNWGDAIIRVPEEIWNQFGIISTDFSDSPEELGLIPLTRGEPYKIQVDQDEVLIPCDYEKRLEALKSSLSAQIQSASTRTVDANYIDKLPNKYSALER